jgi:3-oxoacyl-[acyl-carrier-protein] synthase II
MSLSILGLGTVCALGSGVENFRLGLKGERQPDVVEKTVKGLEQPMSLPVFQAQIDELDRFIPRRALRRIDGFAKMALLSTHLALEDAGIGIENKARVGIVVGSGYGPIRTTFDFLDGIIDDGDHCALPTHFANSVHNALASQISIFLDIQGPCTTITCFDNTVANVLMTARNWLKDGMVDFVIAGLGDEYNDVLGYSAVGYGVSGKHRIQPFDYQKCTFLPGQGYLAFLLSRDLGTSKYGTIDGIDINLSVSETEERLHSFSGPVLLSAKGILSENESFKKIDLTGRKIAAYSPLYGSMPVTAAFDIGAALVFLKDGIVYQPPPSGISPETKLEVIDQSFPLNEASGLICVECSGKDTFNLYHLKKE